MSLIFSSKFKLIKNVATATSVRANLIKPMLMKRGIEDSKIATSYYIGG